MFKSDRYDLVLPYFIIDFSPKKLDASTTWLDMRSGISEL